jgi:hypothetical protein
MFCDACGRELPAGASYCGACGKPLGASLPAPAGGRVGRHIQTVAVLWMIVSAFWLLIGLGVFLVGTIVLPNLLTGLPLHFLVPGITSAVGIVFLAVSVCGLAAGWGLIQREGWARIVIVVLSFFALLRFPLGTALGIYTLWVLLPLEAAQEYARIGRSA